MVRHQPGSVLLHDKLDIEPQGFLAYGWFYPCLYDAQQVPLDALPIDNDYIDLEDPLEQAVGILHVCHHHSGLVG